MSLNNYTHGTTLGHCLRQDLKIPLFTMKSIVFLVMLPLQLIKIKTWP